ncbi:MAG: Ig domain-containing protein [Terracidiphilus sp.]
MNYVFAFIHSFVRSLKTQHSLSTLAVYLLLVVTHCMLGCGSGIRTPPSGLSYSQMVITATINQAIPPDAPTITGVVTSYGVSPALPAGLSMTPSTGVISGTPTTLAAKASYTVIASNSGGSTTALIQITVNPQPPSDLSYSQSSIAGFVNLAMTPDTPTVTGTVTAYTVSPALPVGLSLDPATGIISGTPTSEAGTSMYTVTASNAGGYTTAAVQISVYSPPTITYPQPVIGTWVGHEITPDIPGITGQLSAITVSPGLPAGLNLDPATGIITGTPTAEASQASYTISGSSAVGSATATSSVTITVAPAPNVLLQLGNEYQINTLRFAGNSVLSVDTNSDWILWDYESGNLLARGQSFCYGADMAGPTLAIELPGGFQFRSSTDGHVLSTVSNPGTLSWCTSQWNLATDGSYLAVKTESGLFVYNPFGQLLFSFASNYLIHASIFAALGQLQFPTTSSVGCVDGDCPPAIETISIPGGASTIGPAFQGNFLAWFEDGTKFLTKDAKFIYTYSTSGALLGTIPILSNTFVGGAGNWIWTFSFSQPASSVTVYPINSATPALAISSADIMDIAPSGSSLAILYDDSTFSVIDLSGSAPAQTDYTIPPVNHAFVNIPLGVDSFSPSIGTFAAVSASQWVAGIMGNWEVEDVKVGTSGLIVDGASLPSATPRYLGGVGAALSIAGSSNNVAIATGSGQVLYFDPADPTQQGSLSLTSGNVLFSSDGSLLEAWSQDGSLLNIYSLPSGTVTDTFNFSATGVLSNYNLSASGTTVGQIDNIADENYLAYDKYLEITPGSGSSTILSLPIYEWNSPLISPDGTLAAETTGMTVTIYKNSKLIGTVGGAGSFVGWIAIGWIDNNRLLVNEYAFSSPLPPALPATVYAGCNIVSLTGEVLAAPPLRELHSIQPITSDTVYEPISNAIYSLTTGQAVWTSPYPQDPFSPGSVWAHFADQDRIGAISGPYVVYESDGEIIAVRY